MESDNGGRCNHPGNPEQSYNRRRERSAYSRGKRVYFSECAQLRFVRWTSSSPSFGEVCHEPFADEDVDGSR